MKVGNYEVRVLFGRPDGRGYVAMSHGQQYKLMLINHARTRCDVEVEIDGGAVGTWRINPNSSIKIERPVSEAKKFTFYAEGSVEATQAQIDEFSDDMGLISATFTPEQVIDPEPAEVKKVGRISTQSLSSRGGGTGLSGRSSQRFGTAGRILYDYSGRTTVNLRLVLKDNGRDDGPSPLHPVSNPVPPRV